MKQFFINVWDWLKEIWEILQLPPEEWDDEDEEEDECEFCGGKNGEHEEISTMEQVWAGEPHYAPIGSQRCPNSIPEPDYEPEDDR